ncbi:hypothetical protein F5972_08675 [Microbispora cellulosiformans]|uniref:Uncharacterized protein n=1 Tax=Microbispora cellulosiformans TaxID=2614688 RepID=A0A5J5K536_9ACTN|nr:hypothetical protein [Microbispora cellulosiformans]KAA9379715.1 hypothetical protein F5972_08675 [Microbispora cellulosiformans]
MADRVCPRCGVRWDTHRAATCANPLTPAEVADRYRVEVHPTTSADLFRVLLVDVTGTAVLREYGFVPADRLEPVAAALIANEDTPTREWAVAYTRADGATWLSYDPHTFDPRDRAGADTRARTLRSWQSEEGIRQDATLVLRDGQAEMWRIDPEWEHMAEGHHGQFIFMVTPTGGCTVTKPADGDAELRRVAEQVGPFHRVLVDGVAYELRATGPYRWDVHGTGAHTDRVYGSVRATGSPHGVVWRFGLRSYVGQDVGRRYLASAIRDMVADWPAAVDPLELAARAEATLDRLVTTLNDPAAGWSGDYAALLDRLSGAATHMGAVFEHANLVGVRLEDDHDVEDFGRMAERAAVAAHQVGAAAAHAADAGGAARTALGLLPREAFVRGLLSAYFAASAEVPAGGRRA